MNYESFMISDKLATCEDLSILIRKIRKKDKESFEFSYISITEKILLIVDFDGDLYNSKDDVYNKRFVKITLSDYLHYIFLNEYCYQNGEQYDWGYRFNADDFIRFFSEYETKKVMRNLNEYMELSANYTEEKEERFKL